MIIKDQVINKAGIPLLKQLLHVTSASQKLTASNISNVSVPGYQSKSIDFKNEMQAALKKKNIELVVTNERHMPPANRPKGVKVLADMDDSNASGVNNVDIDREMADLSENQILYSYGARMITRNFNNLKAVIRGKR